MSELKKSLRLKVLPNNAARRILERRHPLGAGHAFLFAFGVYWEDRLEGVMTWGSPISSTAVHRYGIRTTTCLELRKLWMTDVPPKNAESRSLSVAVRLVAKRYPTLRLLVTYCEGEESATAYKAAGWLPQAANRYLSEVKLSDGTVLSLRNFNRQGGKKRFGDQWEGRYVHRRKWVYVLDPTLAPVVQSSIPTFQVGDGGSQPTRALFTSESLSAAPTS